MSLQNDARTMVEAARRQNAKPTAAELARRVIAAYESVRGVEQYALALEKEIEEHLREAK
jgi:hypothetical protein